MRSYPLTDEKGRQGCTRRSRFYSVTGAGSRRSSQSLLGGVVTSTRASSSDVAGSRSGSGRGGRPGPRVFRPFYSHPMDIPVVGQFESEASSSR